MEVPMQHSTPLPNKRVILQPILDEIESGWTIVMPSQLNPKDIEIGCFFQKTDENKEARVRIPNAYFQDADQRHNIKPLVEVAIRNATVK